MIIRFVPPSRGADLAALVREAACIALKEYMTLSHASVRDHTPSLTTPVADGNCIVHTRHFEQALTKVKPSVSIKVHLLVVMSQQHGSCTC